MAEGKSKKTLGGWPESRTRENCKQQMLGPKGQKQDHKSGMEPRVTNSPKSSWKPIQGGIH